MIVLPQSRRPNREPTDPKLTTPIVTALPSLIDSDAISFSELASRMLAGGAKRRVHPSTIHRWRFRGIRGCRLEAFRIGGRWFTNEASFTRFCAAVTATTTDSTSTPLTGCPPERVAEALAWEGF